MSIIYTNMTLSKCYIYDSVQNLFHLHATRQKKNHSPNLLVSLSTLLSCYSRSTCMDLLAHMYPLIQKYSLIKLICYMYFLYKIRLEEFSKFSTLT